LSTKALLIEIMTRIIPGTFPLSVPVPPLFSGAKLNISGLQV
jgi:hypothetical protein